MAIQRSYTIPDDLEEEFIGAFGESYKEMITNESGEEMPNPKSREEHACEMFDTEFKNQVRAVVMQYRVKKLSEEMNKDFSI